MPVEIDGFAVLAAIGRNPAAFPAVKADVTKAAKGFVGKQLKDKAVGLAELRALVGVLGEEALDLVVDGLSDSEIKSLLTRLDKHNPALKAGAAAEQRSGVSALAHGRAEASTRAEIAKAAPAPKAKAKLPAERSASSRAMRAKKQV